MSIELETLQENTQRLTNVMDDYLDVVRDSLSGMADKVSRLAGSIHGGGSSEGTSSGDSLNTEMLSGIYEKVNDIYDIVNENTINIEHIDFTYEKDYEIINFYLSELSIIRELSSTYTEEGKAQVSNIVSELERQIEYYENFEDNIEQLYLQLSSLDSLINKPIIENLQNENQNEQTFGMKKREEDEWEKRQRQEYELYKHIIENSAVPQDYPRPNTEDMFENAFAGEGGGLASIGYHTTGWLGSGGFKRWKLPKKYNEYIKEFDLVKFRIEKAQNKIRNIKKVYPYSEEFANKKLLNETYLDCECCKIIYETTKMVAMFIKTWSLYPKGQYHDGNPNSNKIPAPYAYTNGKIMDKKTISFNKIESDISTLLNEIQYLKGLHSKNHSLATKLKFINVDSNEVLFTNEEVFENSFVSKDSKNEVISIMKSNGYNKNTIKFDPDYFESTKIPELNEIITSTEGWFGKTDDKSTVDPDELTCYVSGKKDIDCERHFFKDNYTRKTDDVQILTDGLKLVPFSDFTLDEDGCGITADKENYSINYSTARFAVPYEDPHNSHPKQFDFDHIAEYSEKLSAYTIIDVYNELGEKIDDESHSQNCYKILNVKYETKEERSNNITKAITDLDSKVFEDIKTDLNFNSQSDSNIKYIVQFADRKDYIDNLGNAYVVWNYKFKKSQKICTVNLYEENQCIQSTDIWYGDTIPKPAGYKDESNNRIFKSIIDNGTCPVKAVFEHEWFNNKCKDIDPKEDINLYARFVGSYKISLKKIRIFEDDELIEEYSNVSSKLGGYDCLRFIVTYNKKSISDSPTSRWYMLFDNYYDYALEKFKEDLIKMYKDSNGKDLDKSRISIGQDDNIIAQINTCEAKPDEIPEKEEILNAVIRLDSNKSWVHYEYTPSRDSEYTPDGHLIISPFSEMDDEYVENGTTITQFPVIEDYKHDGELYKFDHTDPTLPLTVTKDVTITGVWVKADEGGGDEQTEWEPYYAFGARVNLWTLNGVISYDPQKLEQGGAAYREYKIVNDEKVYTGRYSNSEDGSSPYTALPTTATFNLPNVVGTTMTINGQERTIKGWADPVSGNKYTDTITVDYATFNLDENKPTVVDLELDF